MFIHIPCMEQPDGLLTMSTAVPIAESCHPLHEAGSCSSAICFAVPMAESSPALTCNGRLLFCHKHCCAHGIMSIFPAENGRMAFCHERCCAHGIMSIFPAENGRMAICHERCCAHGIVCTAACSKCRISESKFFRIRIIGFYFAFLL